MNALVRRPADEFYDLFESAAANAHRSAQLFAEMLADYPELNSVTLGPLRSASR